MSEVVALPASPRPALTNPDRSRARERPAYADVAEGTLQVGDVDVDRAQALAEVEGARAAPAEAGVALGEDQVSAVDLTAEQGVGPGGRIGQEAEFHGARLRLGTPVGVEPVDKVVWLKGVRGQDITDAHVDSLVRFTAPGVVLLDQAFPGTPPDSWSRAADRAREVLSKATDARGRRFEVIDLPQPDLDRITGEGDDFVSTYANFYVADDSVFMPRFGHRKADDRARGILQEQFPNRDIVPVVIDTVASEATASTAPGTTSPASRSADPIHSLRPPSATPLRAHRPWGALRDCPVRPADPLRRGGRSARRVGPQ